MRGSDGHHPTINAGSSSIQFELFGAPELQRRCRSQLAGIAHGPRISPADARAASCAVPTEEELIVAHHTLDLLQNRG